MPIDYKQWCEQNRNISPLIRAMKSSLPEQYIGFYLSKAFDSEIEYQKQFDWLGRHSLDIYIPSLRLAIEYDGIYYHANKKISDDYKTRACRAAGIYLVHIKEMKATQPKSRKHNEISYYYNKNYKNIDEAIRDLCSIINRRYNTSVQIDVDLNRDSDAFVSYVQHRYHSKSIAYVWPESKDYWIDDENEYTIFDIFHTDTSHFRLRCPHCGRTFILSMKYDSNRKSMMPCNCEYKEIKSSFEEAVRAFKEKAELVSFDNSLHSRRLYDYMEHRASHIWMCNSKEEAEMYKKLGFKNPYIDVYLSMDFQKMKTED